MPSLLQIVCALGLGLVTFAAAAAYDYVEAYLTRATVELKPHHTARLSVAMYAISCVGWFVTIKVSLWYMIPEVLGLYLGSWCAVERQRRAAAWEALRARTLAAPALACHDRPDALPEQQALRARPPSLSLLGGGHEHAQDRDRSRTHCQQA